MPSGTGATNAERCRIHSTLKRFDLGWTRLMASFSGRPAAVCGDAAAGSSASRKRTDHERLTAGEDAGQHYCVASLFDRLSLFMKPDLRDITQYLGTLHEEGRQLCRSVTLHEEGRQLCRSVTPLQKARRLWCYRTKLRRSLSWSAGLRGVQLGLTQRHGRSEAKRQGEILEANGLLTSNG